MGKQQKLKQIRRMQRALQEFLLDPKPNPTLQEKWRKIVDMHKAHAPREELQNATRDFTSEFLALRAKQDKKLIAQKNV